MLDAEQKDVENAIRCGGLAPTKASCIKNVLRCLVERRGKMCLEYLRDLSIDEIKAELSLFKGIGPKTVIFFSLAYWLMKIKITCSVLYGIVLVFGFPNLQCSVG